MLVFGPFMHGLEFDYIFNLTSSKEGLYRINLIPPFGDQLYSKDFDMLYANYLLQNDNAFLELMEKIVYPLYNGKSVYITVSSCLDEFDYISESLQKFIQARYGIVSNNINDIEDLNYLQESNFSIDGLYNLDIDKERFSVMCYNLNNQ